jgi:ribosomal-protein-alanine N-acetyltransferase
MNSHAPSPWFIRWLRPWNGPGECMVIRTPRLLMRLPRYRDAKEFYAYAHDPQVARYVFWDAHTSLRQTRSTLRGIMARNRLENLTTFAIIRQSDSRMVGTIGLVWRDLETNTAEVGFSIARECWGKGLMTEALDAFLRYAFVQMGLSRVEAQHDLRNPASGRVMEKAGMRLEGRMRGRLYYKGERADAVLYAALREEWLSNSPTP